VTWEPLNLAASEYAVDPEPPHDDYHGLLYAGKRHVVSAPTESLKTLIVLVLVLHAIRAGRVVAVIDFEMGAHATRRLLVDLGATDDELAAVYYVEPDGPPSAADIEAIVEAKVELVVLDASMGAFHASGLDDNKRQDVEKFAGTWITPLWQRRVATVVLDHVTKAAEGRGKYAIGSERKVGGVDVHLGLEVVGTTLTRGGLGLVKVRVHKDRPGYLHRPYAAEIALVSDTTTHAITWEIRPAAATDTTGHWQPTVLMERVSTYLQSQADGASRNQIEINVKGMSSKHKRQAIDELIAGGYAREEPGARNARLVRSVKPFTSPPRLDLASTSPGEVAHDLASSPHPLQGGEVPGEVPGGFSRSDLASPTIGDNGYLEVLYAAFTNGHVTEQEWHQASKAHQLIARHEATA
jgi:hypothetical protein